jgi:RNA polymerase sigma factor (sigma-70 family)
MPDPHGLKPLFERVLRDPARVHDPEAWSEFMRRVRPLVRAFLLVHVRQAADASDFTNETLGRVMRRFTDFSGDTVPQFLAWAYRIAVRVRAEAYRKRVPAGCQDLEEPVAPVPDPPPFHPDDVKRVLDALEVLEEPGRGIVRAFYLEDRTCEEIAAGMNRPAGWVRKQKMYAVRKLGETLGELS